MEVIEPVYSLVFTKLVPSFHVHLQVLLGALVLWVLFKKSERESQPPISDKAPKKLMGDFARWEGGGDNDVFTSKALAHSVSPARGDELTKQLQNEMDIINDWEPEPLVQPVSMKHRGICPPITSNQTGKHITVNGIKCLNFATHNYLCLVNNDEIENRAAEAVRKYGVGSCGPRGFFGTVDVHLDLEERLAKFMGTEAAVVYSYGFSTVASAIPAYAKKRDVIFADEAVNFPIQQGLAASRSLVKYFRHNDINHLKELLEQQAALDKKNPRKAAKTRKFLIVEGIYLKTGNICPFPELVELKNCYKLRFFIDESISFGTLGKTGRGLSEHFNIPMHEMDLMMSTMEGSLASIGGFCVGTTFVVEHQILSGSGYCFSASLPPLLTVAATTALNIIDDNPDLLKDLSNNCNLVHELLRKSSVLAKYFRISGFQGSPVKHLFPLERRSVVSDELQPIVNLCLLDGVALTLPAFHPEDTNHAHPSLRLIVNARLVDADFEKMLQVLEKSVVAVFENVTSESS